MPKVKVPLTCPASETVYPVLSLNDEDVQCQITGRLQPANGAPCTGCYAETCKIWQTTKRLEAQGIDVAKHGNVMRRSHTLGDGIQREIVRA